MTAWRNPLVAMPFEGQGDDVPNALEDEFAAMPFGRRWQLLRKMAGREIALRLSGQARRRVDTVPATTRRLLWSYSWTTVGDAILDLAPRSLIPPGIAVDLLIAPHLAPLFATDGRFRQVFTDVSQCDGGHDFVLLDSLRSSAVRMKARRFATLPFATMRNHHVGERFDRAAYADRRLRQLFALPPGPVVAPVLDLGSDRRTMRLATGQSQVRIGVALGARVEAKLYPHWPAVLEAIVAGWPDPFRPPRFHLFGSGDPARAQRAAIGRALLAAYCVDRIDTGTLRDAAIELSACTAFLGVDGGLMHVAIGVATPGLALFTRIDPRYFLRPGSPIVPLATPGALDTIAPGEVAAEYLRLLPTFADR